MKWIRFGLGPFLSGVIFSLGLGVSGMTEARNILSFLDIFGHWQAELILVMSGALLTFAIGFKLISRKKSPLFEDRFHLPQRSQIDRNLIFGAGLFGIGWGMTGLCPGPGIVSLVSCSSHALVFCLSMFVGMFLSRFWNIKKKN